MSGKSHKFLYDDLSSVGGVVCKIVDKQIFGKIVGQVRLFKTDGHEETVMYKKLSDVFDGAPDDAEKVLSCVFAASDAARNVMHYITLTTESRRRHQQAARFLSPLQQSRRGLQQAASFLSSLQQRRRLPGVRHGVRIGVVSQIAEDSFCFIGLNFA